MFKALWELVKAILYINIGTAVAFIMYVKWFMGAWINGEDLIEGSSKRIAEFLERRCGTSDQDLL